MTDQVFWLFFGGIAAIIGLAFTVVGTKVVVASWRRQAPDRSWPRTTAEVVSAAQERRVLHPRPRRLLRRRLGHPAPGLPCRRAPRGGPARVAPADPTRSHTSPGAISAVVAAVAVFLVIGVLILCLGIVLLARGLLG